MDREQLRLLVLTQLQSLAASGVAQLPRRAPDVLRQGNVGECGSSDPGVVSTEEVAVSSPAATQVKSASMRERGLLDSTAPSTPPQHGSVGLTVIEQTIFDVPSSLPVLTSVEDRCRALEELRGEVASCTRCPELVRNRTQTVFGVGSVQPRLCFFGEAPGADEDIQGEPFVGRAGELLNRMIAACTLRREDVYILNVLKCRPPNNRAPLPEETENCRPFFERQLEILRPEFICCLGASAAQALFKSRAPVNRFRGRVHQWRWAKVVVTYHPAYLLRSPQQKPAAWEDLKLLMKEMGITLPDWPGSTAKK